MNEIVDSPTPTTVPARVEIIGFNMPFWSLVGFMIKLAFAAIPAAIIIAIIWGIIGFMFAGVMAGITHH
jgi:hypothetical protein